MSVLIQRPRRDGCHVAILDGRRSAAPYGHRMTPSVRIAGAHQNNAFEANIPGRMNVHSIPVASMRRSTVGGEVRHRIRLLEEWVGGLVRC